jgi:hypothetical protein
MNRPPCAVKRSQANRRNGGVLTRFFLVTRWPPDAPGRGPRTESLRQGAQSREAAGRAHGTAGAERTALYQAWGCS